jgi:ABC-type branched-subunit amino acid transport system substrate-binding protein
MLAAALKVSAAIAVPSLSHESALVRFLVVEIKMVSKAAVIFALTIAWAALANAQPEPREDKAKLLRDLATRLGQVVGAAYACPEIAKSRVVEAKDRVTAILKAEPAGGADASPVALFEANFAAGIKATVERRSSCAAVERDLASLEQIYAKGAASNAAGSTPEQRVAQTDQQAITASKPTAQSAARGPETVRGISDNEIRFGIAAPLSGASKKLGAQMKIGIETAFHSANDAGGIYGRRLRLFAADDQYEPARTVDAMKELCDLYDVFAFVGNVGTPTAVVALPYALDRRMLFFGAFTGANVLRSEPPDRYVFNYRASYSEETSAVVEYLVTARGIKPEEIAVFSQDDSFGDAGYAGVTTAVQRLKDSKRGTVLRLNYKRNTDDIEKALTELRSHRKPIKAIITVATYRPAAKFIQKARELFPNMIFTNVSFVGSSALRDELKQLNVKNIKDIIVTQVVPPVEGYSSLVLKYKSELHTYFPAETPDYVSFEGYITARLMIEALNRAGQQLDTEKLVETLETMRDVDIGLGFGVNFSKEEHQGSHKIWATQLTEAGTYERIKLQ